MLKNSILSPAEPNRIKQSRLAWAPKSVSGGNSIRRRRWNSHSQQHRRAPLSVRLLMVFSTLERGKVKHLPQISASVGCELSEDTEKDKYCYKFHCDAPRATCRRWLAGSPWKIRHCCAGTNAKSFRFPVAAAVAFAGEMQSKYATMSHKFPSATPWMK